MSSALYDAGNVVVSDVIVDSPLAVRLRLDIITSAPLPETPTDNVSSLLPAVSFAVLAVPSAAIVASAIAKAVRLPPDAAFQPAKV
jgi:hypothetical protein